MKGKKNPFFGYLLEPSMEFWKLFKMFFLNSIFCLLFEKKIIEFVRRNLQKFATLHKKTLTPMPFF